MNLKSIITIFLVLPALLFAQANTGNGNDPKVNAWGLENNLFNSNLDSLLKLTYIKKSLEGHKTSTKKSPTYPDSVISKKLSRIKGYIKLKYTQEVKKFIQFYSDPINRKKVNALYGLMNYHSEFIENKLKEYKLPLDLKYIAASGSGLFSGAISQQGASGIWQLSYPVAKRYELNITSYTDERRDIEKSTTAAVKYLKEMYSIYHDWDLAIGAYFCGAANINKAISRAKGSRNYQDIYSFLPKYSREHLASFVAIVYLDNYRKEYHISPVKVKMQKQITSLEMKKKIHFGQISEILNISMQELKDLNPVYKRGIIQPVNDNSILKLSSKDINSFKKLEDSIYNYKTTAFFPAPKTVVVPPKVVSGKSSSYNYEPSVPKNKAKLEYTIKSGDNLGLIAQWYNVSISGIKSWNNLYYKKTIYPGQKLNIYVPKYEVSKYKNVNTMTYNQKQKLAGKKTKSIASTSKTKSTSSSSGSVLGSVFSLSKDIKSTSSYVYYKVKRGDNLWDISRKFENTSVEKIMKLNNLKKGYKLYAGQILKIKRK